MMMGRYKFVSSRSRHKSDISEGIGPAFPAAMPDTVKEITHVPQFMRSDPSRAITDMPSTAASLGSFTIYGRTADKPAKFIPGFW